MTRSLRLALAFAIGLAILDGLLILGHLARVIG